MTPNEILLALRQLGSEFPRYHFWPSVAGGLVYASRRRSSPPVVLRSPVVENLREQVVRDMEYRGERWG